MTDSEIQNLDFKKWSANTISISAPSDDLNPDGIIEWELKPTYFDVALRIQDLMVLRIIKDNNWKRPIYFGVTVSPTSMLNLEDYLTMEGLAYRLINNKLYPINQEKMSNNLLPFVGSKAWFKDYDSNRDSIEDLSISKEYQPCLLYTSPSPRDVEESRMPSSA